MSKNNPITPQARLAIAAILFVLGVVLLAFASVQMNLIELAPTIKAGKFVGLCIASYVVITLILNWYDRRREAMKKHYWEDGQIDIAGDSFSISGLLTIMQVEPVHAWEMQVSRPSPQIKNAALTNSIVTVRTRQGVGLGILRLKVEEQITIIGSRPWNYMGQDGKVTKLDSEVGTSSLDLKKHYDSQGHDESQEIQTTRR